MLRITVTSEPINVRTGNKDGKQWTRREQSAYAHIGHAFPARFLISLGETGQPYPPGEYTLDPKSLQVGQYGDLQFGRTLHLVPEKAVKAA